MSSTPTTQEELTTALEKTAAADQTAPWDPAPQWPPAATTGPTPIAAYINRPVDAPPVMLVFFTRPIQNNSPEPANFVPWISPTSHGPTPDAMDPVNVTPSQNAVLITTEVLIHPGFGPQRLEYFAQANPVLLDLADHIPVAPFTITATEG